MELRTVNNQPKSQVVFLLALASQSVLHTEHIHSSSLPIQYHHPKPATVCRSVYTGCKYIDFMFCTTRLIGAPTLANTSVSPEEKRVSGTSASHQFFLW